jgi:hypothetical protein
MSESRKHPDNDSAEFQAFLGADPITPPSVIRERVHTVVTRDLNPGLARVGTKVAGLHLVAAMLSLAICPQFGIGPFGGDAGLMAVLMNWGWVACAAGCGASFMLGTGLLSAFVLNPDEKRVLAASSGWVFTSLAASSWAVFMMAVGVNPETAHTGHHVVTSVAPEAFSAAWSAIWALTAALSAWLGFRVKTKGYPVPFGGSAH